jgi:hypothetical protein
MRFDYIYVNPKNFNQDLRMSHLLVIRRTMTDPVDSIVEPAWVPHTMYDDWTSKFFDIMGPGEETWNDKAIFFLENGKQKRSFSHSSENVRWQVSKLVPLSFAFKTIQDATAAKLILT